jgi:brassinosteroid insensitive 1-associated receptor kinase 1
VNSPELTGPVPDFSRAKNLYECEFLPSNMCYLDAYVPELHKSAYCDFRALPECEGISIVQDCAIVADWLPTVFDPYYCCDGEAVGLTCVNNRIVILDLSSPTAYLIVDGQIPSSIGDLDMLEQLLLQDKDLTGNLPLSLASISSLQTVNISNNKMSGVLPFTPMFELLGLESNLDLSLPSNGTSIGLTTPENDTISAPNIAGITAGVLVVVLLVTAIMLHLVRRKRGIETELELRLIPKYSSSDKQIRLVSMINSGGFGVVWKARYKEETVAIKLLRMDKEKALGKNESSTRNVKKLKMVADEAAIMELMVHDRIVKFVIFEIESLGLVIEYLPLGSLYDHIEKSNGEMSWSDRYQIMLDICEGMEFLHSEEYADGSQKLVLFHQDLKSGNILLKMEGSPPVLRGKITDFGLSCMMLFV